MLGQNQGPLLILRETYIRGRRGSKESKRKGCGVVWHGFPPHRAKHYRNEHAHE